MLPKTLRVLEFSMQVIVGWKCLLQE